MDYVFTERGLELVREDGRSALVIAGEGSLGILYEGDHDGDGGMLVGHGEESLVRRRHEQRLANLAASFPEEGAFARALGVPADTLRQAARVMADRTVFLTIPVADLTPAVLDEINLSLNATGRIGLLAERLEALGGGAPRP